MESRAFAWHRKRLRAWMIKGLHGPQRHYPGKARMKTINTLLAIVLCTVLSATAGANIWTTQKTASYDEEEGTWFAACLGRFGGGAARHPGALAPPSLLLQVTTHTVAARRARGDVDPYRPVLGLGATQVSQGRSRPHDGPEGTTFAVRCVGDSSEELECESDRKEYRAHYQIGTSAFTEVWMEQDYVSADFRSVYEAIFEDEAVSVEDVLGKYWEPVVFSSWSVWADWPDNLFDTNETRSFRVNFGGLASTNPTIFTHGRDPALAHVSAVRYTYSYGLSALRSVQKCVDDHVRFGRLDSPQSSIRPISLPHFPKLDR